MSPESKLWRRLSRVDTFFWPVLHCRCLARPSGTGEGCGSTEAKVCDKRARRRAGGRDYGHRRGGRQLSAERRRSASPRPVRSVYVLGVRVDDVTFDDALELCDAFVAEGGPHLIATVNTEFVMAAQRDTDYRRTLNEAALCVPDGIGLLTAARLSGQTLRQHVRGTDLVDQIAALARSKDYGLFLLGGQGGAAAEAAAALARRWPGIRIAGWYEGSPAPEHDTETLAAVKAAGKVDIVLVAYGAPAQERWIERNLGASGAALGVGVGGVFNFLAGRARRAPRWVRRLELEWLHRLVTEPWRWRRQLALPRFILLCLANVLRRRPVVREALPGGAPRR